MILPFLSRKCAPQVLESTDGYRDTAPSWRWVIRQRGQCDRIRFRERSSPHPHGHLRKAHFNLPAVPVTASTPEPFAACIADSRSVFSTRWYGGTNGRSTGDWNMVESGGLTPPNSEDHKEERKRAMT